MPSADRSARLAELIATPFAHRGLHGGGVIENSRAAFEAAIAVGHGIELDVQVTGDGHALVIHDYELDRLTEGVGRICGMVAAELERIRLRGGEETIPSLPQVLKLVAGRAPVLIEVKSPGRRVSTLSGAVQAALVGYDGPVAVMSFNPEIGRWFARNAPDVLRGLVVTEAGRRWRGTVARHLALWRSNADFLAYDIRDLPSRFAARQRAKGLPVLTWTCRSVVERARAASHADQIIYERVLAETLPDPKTGSPDGALSPGQRDDRSTIPGKRSA
jgi:glycerophosphoryl diester phosphodiesterase